MREREALRDLISKLLCDGVALDGRDRFGIFDGDLSGDVGETGPLRSFFFF